MLSCEKVKGSRSVCVLGQNVTVDMVLALSNRALVVRFEYLKLSRAFVISWVREYWKSLLISVPKVLTLVNGWTMFQFLTIKDCATVESRYWILGEGSLVLKR